MGSNETATATTGGPRVIDVFDGNGAPSGPNYLLFSDADRLSDSLPDRSGVGWSPTPHAPVLGAPQRAVTGCENVLSPMSRRREVRSLRADRPRGESGGDGQAAA